MVHGNSYVVTMYQHWDKSYNIIAVVGSNSLIIIAIRGISESRGVKSGFDLLETVAEAC